MANNSAVILKNENLRHHAAYLYYFNDGNIRPLSEVASKFKVAIGTVFNWSYSFDWETRAKEDMQAKMLEDRKRIQRKILKSREDNIQALADTRDEFLKKLNAGKVDMTSPDDMLAVIKLMNQLLTELKVDLDDKDTVENNENTSDNKAVFNLNLTVESN